jgi:hypothetical protein
MKKSIAIIALCLLLLDGGYHLSVFMKDDVVHCKTAIYMPKSTKTHKYISKGLASSVVDFADLDLEDDGSSDKKNNRNSLLEINKISENWFLALIPFMLLKKHTCHTNSQIVFCLPKLPIYIKNKVLRI